MAARVAEEVLAKFHPHISEFTLSPSTGGIFEVQVNDNLIFSKKALGRFPEVDEIPRLFEEKVQI